MRSIAAGSTLPRANDQLDLCDGTFPVKQQPCRQQQRAIHRHACPCGAVCDDRANCAGVMW